MSSPSLDDRVVSASSTLEVRWILPGPLEAGTISWFERFVESTESREDAYLLIPQIDGLSVKIRGGRRFDVKSYRGSPGVLEIPGRAKGRIDRWHKWSFPLAAGSEPVGKSAAWQRVRKARSIGWFGGSEDGSFGTFGLDGDGTCAVELTKILIEETPWWTLGIEACGPPGARRGALEAAASSVFDEPIGFGQELGLDDSRTYAEWLRPDRASVRPPSPERSPTQHDPWLIEGEVWVDHSDLWRTKAATRC